MRFFYNRVLKNVIWIYCCFFCVFSYRLVYNEFYYRIHDEISVDSVGNESVYPSGKIVGLYTECDGIFVIDTCEIEGKDGNFYDPSSSVVKKGDYILRINGQNLDSKEEMIDMVDDGKGETVLLTISRDDKIVEIEITPVCAKNGRYMLGIWVRDDLAGIGTITYFTADGNFAALGHGMGDGETDGLLAAKGGEVYISDVIGIEKGEKGKPGEVKAVIYYGIANHLGKIAANNGNGIYGKLDKEEVEKYTKTTASYQIGNKQEIKIGKAQILSEISGTLQTYEIEISYVDYLAINSKKGLHIEVTDDRLLQLTGGIVQGMSGSPVLQNGRIVGAVTHVLVNDPTRGYGIFIESMLEH